VDRFRSELWFGGRGQGEIDWLIEGKEKKGENGRGRVI
jgi:hypothetical protein